MLEFAILACFIAIIIVGYRIDRIETKLIVRIACLEYDVDQLKRKTK